MQIPAEISFHNCQGSAAAEDDIRDHIERLEHIYGRMTTIRVRVDQSNQNSADTIPPVVRIEITVPGHKDIVVAHEPGHLQRKYQAPDLRNAVNEAFRIAERQLRDLKEQLRGRTKEPLHDAENQFLGQVAELNPDQDFGFLLTKEGGMLYFHRNSILSGDFDALTRGTSVYYVEGMGDTGPTAMKVRVKAAAG